MQFGLLCQSDKWHNGGCGSPQNLIFYIHTKQIQMKIIYTRQNADGSYDQCGMNNQRLTSHYKTTSGFLRYGIPSNFYGNTLKLEVWYGDNIYRNPDKTMFVTV